MSTLPQEPPATSLKTLAVRGAVWTTGGVAASSLIRLATNLIATRLLAPGLFGLMALVSTILIGLSNFSDTGASASVVRDRHGEDPSFLNTAWTLQLIRGALLWCACAGCAWPAASFYGDARLRWLIPLIGLNSLVGGFSSTTLMTSLRRMDVSRLILLDVATQFAGSAVLVVWAWLSPSVWALAISAMTPPLLRTLFSHFLAPRRPHRLHWDPSAAHELLHFGRWIWLTSALAFLAAQIDRLLLGKLLPLSLFGVYIVATLIAEVPRGLLQSIGINVLFPSFARIAGRPRAQVRALVLEHRERLLLLIAAAIALLAAFGDPFVRLVFDARYAGAAWMLPILALGLWPSVLAKTLEGALLALAKPHYAAQANVAKLLFTGVAVPLAFAFYGVRGAVIAVALNDLPAYALISRGLRREGISGFAQDLRATACFLAATAAAFALRSAIMK
jgi:O-antigen/teichoic acid export membrane protein